VFRFNFNIHVKVRILMPQKLHDAVQKALIAEEELNNGGQGRTPSRLTGQDDIRSATTSDTNPNILHGIELHPEDLCS
jgi:hypothetical protein